MTDTNAPAVYRAITEVQAGLATIGIGKDRKNEQQGYKFRGIDDIYNAVARLLAKYGLCILPRCTERVCVERQTAKGGTLFYATVRVEFDFVAREDGSKHTVVTYGEAMDSGDKATNKAMSAAYKYALLQAFAIPTEGDNDADSTTHEVVPKKALPGAMSGADVNRAELAAMSPEQQDYIRTEAAEVKRLHAAGMDVYGYVESRHLDAEEKMALWSLLPSDIRSAIKRGAPKPSLASQP